MSEAVMSAQAWPTFNLRSGHPPLVAALLKAVGVRFTTLFGAVNKLLAVTVHNAFGGLGLALAPVTGLKEK